MKRNIATIMVILSLVGVVTSLMGCGSKSSEVETKVATVQRGDITIDITAAGNLALSTTEDLPVELFYGQSGSAGTKGTIGEVLVEEGDTVKEGQVLVTVDKDEWNDQLAALKDAITTANSTLLSAQSTLLTAQQTLESTRDTSAEEKAVLSAEVSLQQAQDNLNAGVTATDFEAVEAALNRAKAYYNYVQDRLQGVSNADDFLLTQEKAQEALDTAQANYDNALSGYDTNAVALLKKQVEIKAMELAAAQKTLADVPQDIATQEIQVTLAEGKVKVAQKALEDAQEKLAEAQSKSPEVKAPFDGFITTVNVAGGDEVLNGTVAVQIADPNKFEADISVSEMDISQVNLGQEATISADALSGVSLPAKVTHIAPTATIQSGVVNYKVTVEVQSVPTEATSDSSKLREGLTVTVSIIVQQKTDVLLVPYAAITKEGGQSYVQVVSSTGAIEKRAIKTGITDYKNTEVTEGLSEGEKVIIPQSTKTTTTTTQQQPGGIMIPGVGGGPPPPGGG